MERLGRGQHRCLSGKQRGCRIETSKKNRSVDRQDLLDVDPRHSAE